MKKIVNGTQKTVYYYEHDESACYYCIVNASDSGLSSLQNSYSKGEITRSEYTIKLTAYYNAIARERYSLVKASDYVNGSAVQYN